MKIETKDIISEVDGVGVLFREFDVPGAREVDGNVFPLALQLSNSTGGFLTLDDATQAVRNISEKGIITTLLNKHGALLLRGVGDPSPKAFSKLVHAAEENRGHKPYEQLGFSGSRTLIDKEVFSASEAPKHIRIAQHNENAIHRRFPSNIHFFCHKAAIKGGASPLAHSGELFDRVSAEMPQFVEDLKAKGLLTTETYQPPGSENKAQCMLTMIQEFPFSWAGYTAFGREIRPEDDFDTMKAKCEKQVARLTPDFCWKDDNSLEVRQYVPGLRRIPGSGRPVWFNSIGGRYSFAKDRGAVNPPYIGDDGLTYPPEKYQYSDGSPIPLKYLARLVEITDEIKIPVSMEEGDVLLVDNYQVSHGREPWTEGDRVILVSQWDTDKLEERICDY